MLYESDYEFLERAINIADKETLSEKEIGVRRRNVGIIFLFSILAILAGYILPSEEMSGQTLALFDLVLFGGCGVFLLALVASILIVSQENIYLRLRNLQLAGDAFDNSKYTTPEYNFTQALLQVGQDETLNHGIAEQFAHLLEIDKELSRNIDMSKIQLVKRFEVSLIQDGSGKKIAQLFKSRLDQETFAIDN